MRKYSIQIAVLCGLLSSGCAMLKTVSVTSVPAKRDQMVIASAQKWVILGFTFDNDFVDRLVDDLKAKCPDGVVAGILTKDEVISYLFFYKNTVTAKGFCVKGSATASASKARVPSAESSDNEALGGM
jgi:hypothetical protein